MRGLIHLEFSELVAHILSSLCLIVVPNTLHHLCRQIIPHPPPQLIPSPALEHTLQIAHTKPLRPHFLQHCLQDPIPLPNHYLIIHQKCLVTLPNHAQTDPTLGLEIEGAELGGICG